MQIAKSRSPCHRGGGHGGPWPEAGQETRPPGPLGLDTWGQHATVQFGISGGQGRCPPAVLGPAVPSDKAQRGPAPCPLRPSSCRWATICEGGPWQAMCGDTALLLHRGHGSMIDYSARRTSLCDRREDRTRQPERPGSRVWQGLRRWAAWPLTRARGCVTVLSRGCARDQPPRALGKAWGPARTTSWGPGGDSPTCVGTDGAGSAG